MGETIGLFAEDVIDFLDENKPTKGSSSIKDQTYAVTSKETIAGLTEDDIEQDGEIDKSFLIDRLHEAVEELENVINAVEKIIYIKKVLNVGKDSNLDYTAVKDVVIHICTTKSSISTEIYTEAGVDKKPV